MTARKIFRMRFFYAALETVKAKMANEEKKCIGNLEGRFG